jgi:hydrogenase maturation protein HypF
MTVQGVVQGVGFRPFIHGVATREGLSGWVQNGPEGVHLEVQGSADAVRVFASALRAEAPSAASVAQVVSDEVPVREEAGFRILASRGAGRLRAGVPADLATCAECAAEVNTPTERRYHYPFTNCARCGPRFTVINSLPYDRANTTLAGFALCVECQREHDDPSDRRFHAQPIACPACGPVARLLAADGSELVSGAGVVRAAADALRQGRILALKGLGGFQLMVDATSEHAVTRLRVRKQRQHKPFAVMVSTLDAARRACVLDAAQEALLSSPAAPIVLLPVRGEGPVAAGVAPDNPWLGVMLPYTPLHRLLLDAVGRPLVCTSGNVAEEPMSTANDEALTRLGHIADVFLVHDRDIARPVDDSVTRMGPSGPQVLRRARGHAPLTHPFPAGPSIVALGGQLKSTVALTKDGAVLVSQHLGDLASVEAGALLSRTVDDVTAFLDVTPTVVACDLHPDYASTRLAERLASLWGAPLARVQHHHAHIAACMAEHQLQGPVLGLAWDGAGLGSDGTLWGGEALVVDAAGFVRAAHLRPFPLPGGERAMREPRRAALGLAHEAWGGEGRASVRGLFTGTDAGVLTTMLERGVNSPRTSSVGRLFDAVAALAGVCAVSDFEGQAAMALEFAADAADPAHTDATDATGAYPLPLLAGEPAVADWEPLLQGVLADRARGVSAGVIGARFHNALAQLAEDIALRVGVAQVALSGGCFANLRLTRLVSQRLAARGFKVHLPARFPPNDGGLSLGQAYVVAQARVAALRSEEGPCA